MQLAWHRLMQQRFWESQRAIPFQSGLVAARLWGHLPTKGKRIATHEPGQDV